MDIGQFGNLVNGFFDTANDGRRYLGRCGHSVKKVNVESRHPAFRDRRYIWQHWGPLLCGDSQRFHLTLLDEWHNGYG